MSFQTDIPLLIAAILKKNKKMKSLMTLVIKSYLLFPAEEKINKAKARSVVFSKVVPTEQTKILSFFNNS